MRCQLGPGFETTTQTRSAMIQHLEAHLNAGHKVPEDALEELRAEIAKLGDAITE